MEKKTETEMETTVGGLGFREHETETWMMRGLKGKGCSENDICR